MSIMSWQLWHHYVKLQEFNHILNIVWFCCFNSVLCWNPLCSIYNSGQKKLFFSHRLNTKSSVFELPLLLNEATFSYEILYEEQETYHFKLCCVSHVSIQFFAEIQEFQQRSCLVPYHCYSKILKKVGTRDKFCTSRQILDTYSWNFEMQL